MGGGEEINLIEDSSPTNTMSSESMMPKNVFWLKRL